MAKFNVNDEVVVSTDANWIKVKEPFAAKIDTVYEAKDADGNTVTLYTLIGEGTRMHPDGTEETTGGWGNAPESALTLKTNKPSVKTEGKKEAEG